MMSPFDVPTLRVVGPNEVPKPQRPQLDESAYHGPLGAFAKESAQHCEADPVNLLVTAIAAVGCFIGPGPHFTRAADKHGARFWPVIVGYSASGAKGTGLGVVLETLKRADRSFVRGSITSPPNVAPNGLIASGEGLIDRVRDPRWEPAKATKKKKGDAAPELNENQVRAEDGQVLELVDRGVQDKRLLTCETEFSAILRKMTRESSTISQVARNAYDGGSLEIATRAAPVTATDPHITIVGHVTPEELTRHLNPESVEVFNGFANRFGWFYVEGGEPRPRGGVVPDDVLNRHAMDWRRRAENARRIGTVTVSEEAEAEWEPYYLGLRDRRGFIANMTSRAKVMPLRVAMIFALMDGSNVIEREHLAAALAIQEYCEDSIAFLWPTADRAPADGHAAKVFEALNAHPAGLGRAELIRKVHLSSIQLTRALALLEDDGLARKVEERTGGRPREVWFPGGAS